MIGVIGVMHYTPKTPTRDDVVFLTSTTIGHLPLPNTISIAFNGIIVDRCTPSYNFKIEK